MTRRDHEPDDLAAARGCINGVLISAGMIAAAGLALALSTCVPSPAVATPFHPSNARDGVITVWDAPGCNITLYRWHIAYALEQGYQIEVRGRCDSACGLVLEHHDAIRSGQIDIRRATFGIHAATRNGRIDRELTREVMAVYPQAALDAGRIPGPEAQTVETVYRLPGRVVLAEIGREH